MKCFLEIISLSVFLFTFSIPSVCGAQPLKTYGYLLGIQSVSSLFEIPKYISKSGHGGLVGIETGVIFSTPTLLLPKSVRGTAGFFIGINTGYVIGREEEKELSHVGREIQLLREVYSALTFELRGYLNSSVNRHRALNYHIEYLTNLANREKERWENIARIVEAFDKQTQDDIRALAEMEKTYFEFYEEYAAKKAESIFLAFIDKQEKSVKAKALLGALQKMQEKHEFFYPLLVKRIAAIKANREALIQGIRVIEIEEIDLGIIERVR